MIRRMPISGRPHAGTAETARDAGFSVFRAVLSAYIIARTPLSAVRHELIRCVAADQDRAVSMLHYLRVANESGLVTDSAMQILVTDIQAAVDSPDAVEPDRRVLLAGHFEICARVGKGGIGEVFLARDLRRMKTGCHDPRVAIKIIQHRHCTCREAIRSLQREAVNAQCLVHRGIRRVYELDRERQRFFLVMEWLDGETLATRLDRTQGRPMSAAAFRAVLLQVTSALSFAHRHGIVHGDIKPGNVFMTTNSDVKLLDFGHTEGIASTAGSEPFAITRGYSSIEVHHGAQPEIRDDVYSLALMAYRMLAGRRPFGRHSAVEVEVLGLKPERPSMLNRRQWRALQAGLALYREQRPATVLELCDELLSISGEPFSHPRLAAA